MRNTVRFYISMQLIIYLQCCVFFLKIFNISLESDLAKNILTFINIIFFSLSLSICIYLREYIYNVLRQSSILILILLFAIMSIIWSPLPAVSVNKAINLLLQVMQMLSIFLAAMHWKIHIVTLMKRVTLIIVIMNVAFYLLFPNAALSVALGESGRYDCLMPSPNNLAQIALLTFAIHIPRKLRELKINELLAISMSLFCLYLSGSATGLVCIIILVNVNLALQINKKWQTLIIVSTTLTSIIFTLLFSRDNIDIFGLFNRDANLTGRTVIWASALVDLERDSREFIGYGLGGFWDASGHKVHSNDFLDNFMQAHNGYLDTYLQIGVFGVVLFFILIIRMVRLIRKYIVTLDLRSVGLVLIAILINNFTESSFLSPKHPNWLIFTLFYFMLSYRSAMKPTSNEVNNDYLSRDFKVSSLSI